MSTPAVRDTFARPLHDLRISVTDRSNFRCTYCMPREIFGRDYQFLERPQLLTVEEITRLARIFAAPGVEKLRITGGEPLIRRDVEQLVGMLTGIEGVRDIAMTPTARCSHAKRAAWLERVQGFPP